MIHTDIFYINTCNGICKDVNFAVSYLHFNLFNLNTTVDQHDNCHHGIICYLSTGIMTNVRDIVIAHHQRAVFSSVMRTATYKDGTYTMMTDPGAYRFGSFVMKDYAMVEFHGSEKSLSLGVLELNYGAVLTGSQLSVISNEIRVHPGATITLTGGGYGPGLGPGAGSTV